MKKLLALSILFFSSFSFCMQSDPLKYQREFEDFMHSKRLPECTTCINGLISVFKESPYSQKKDAFLYAFTPKPLALVNSTTLPLLEKFIDNKRNIYPNTIKLVLISFNPNDECTLKYIPNLGDVLFINRQLLQTESAQNLELLIHKKFMLASRFITKPDNPKNFM